MQPMTSNRPYLIRATYDWLVDNGLTPHLLVNTEGQNVVVPLEFAENGKIILNVSPSAVRDIYLGNDMISFNARFHGRPMEVFIPPHNVLGIYARENDMGIFFTEEPPQANGENVATPEDQAPAAPRPPKGRPNLKIIK